jgi:hypothetical protein
MLTRSSIDRQVDLKAALSGYGLSGSPEGNYHSAVARGIVYLGTVEGGWLLALKAANGALVWKTQPYANVTASPAVARRHHVEAAVDAVQAIVVGAEAVAGLVGHAEAGRQVQDRRPVAPDLVHRPRGGTQAGRVQPLQRDACERTAADRADDADHGAVARRGPGARGR